MIPFQAEKYFLTNSFTSVAALVICSPHQTCFQLVCSSVSWCHSAPYITTVKRLMVGKLFDFGCNFLFYPGQKISITWKKRNLQAPARLQISHFHVGSFVCAGAAQDPGAGYHWAGGTRAEPSWGGRTDLKHCGHWLDLCRKAVLTLGSKESLPVRVVFAEVLSCRDDLVFYSEAVGVSLLFRLPYMR